MSDSTFFFFLFVFGAIVGSFLNVVILRYNTGASFLSPSGRSHCFSCGKKLDWWELIPIASLIFLRGRCSHCKSQISWQYPLVEAISGLLLVLIFLKYSFSPFLVGFYFLIWSVLLVITVYDLRHKIIPNGLVYLFIVATFLFNIFSTGNPHIFFKDVFLSMDFWAGPVFYAFFALLWLVSRGRWLGFGDAKLVLGIGFLLGFTGGLSALMLSFWIGAIFGITLIVWGKLVEKNIIPRTSLPRVLGRLTMKSEIPFAPFLILGTAIVFFTHVSFF